MSFYALREMAAMGLEPAAAACAGLADALAAVAPPGSPARGVLAAARLFERGFRRYDDPGFSIEGVGEKVVLASPFCEVVRFVADGGRARSAPTVLVLAPLSGHHASLLRDTVSALLQDHEVLITRWRNARDVPAAEGRFGLDKYIDTVIAAIRHAGPELHLLAVCQPAPLALAAVARLAESKEEPRSLTLMGGPIDTRVNPSAVDRFARAHSLAWFERTLIMTVPAGLAGAGRRVYPGFLQLASFLAMNPGRHWRAQVDYAMALLGGDDAAAARHRAFYDDYCAVIDMPAEFYLETIAAIFQDHLLPKGAFAHRGARVDPGVIRRTGLMTIEGEKDDICAPGVVRAAHDLTPGIPEARRAHHLQAGVGHYGLFSGRRWRAEIYPRLRDFVRRMDG